MKTVSGHVVSSKPISLPKAAKILSKFVTVENGASHATSAYLQSASTAFDELAHLHEELKAPKSEHKSKHCESDCAKELRQETELSVEPGQSVTFDLSEEPYEDLVGNRKKQKKSKNKKVGADEPYEDLVGNRKQQEKSNKKEVDADEPYEDLVGNRKKQKKPKKKKVDADHTGNFGDNEGNLHNRVSKGDGHLTNGVLDEVNWNLSNGAEKNAVVAGAKKKKNKQSQNWEDEKGNLVESGMEALVRNDGRVMAIDEAKKKASESTKVEENGGDFSEQSSKKKQKKKGGDDGSLQDNGVVVKERKSSKKKREHEEIEEVREEGGLMQRPNKKLKK